MSIQGSLEDVGVAEVLQFVHLGGSTGTLVLTRDEDRVEIGFHEGGVINAWDSRSLRLGELLVARGLASREVVECALAIQQTKPDPPPSIGDILIDEGFVRPDDLRETVVEQIRQAVSRAIEWTRGSFVFVKGPPRRRDQFDPDAVLTYKLNTQALLLDIARTLDHARSGLATQPSELGDEEPDFGIPSVRRQAATPGGPDSHPAASALAVGASRVTPPPLPRIRPAALQPPPLPRTIEGSSAPSATDRGETIEGPANESGEVADGLADDEAEAALEGLGAGGEEDARPIVRVVTENRDSVEELVRGLDCEFECLAFDDVQRLAERPTNYLVVDLRPRRSIGDLAAVTAAANGVEPIVLLPDVALAASAYGLGARAVIPDQPGALAAYLGTMFAAERALRRGRGHRKAAESNGFARLREIFAGLRESAPSATRILGLMRVVSNYAQRAAVFVVLGDQARVIGAFGRSKNGRPLADVLRKVDAFTLSGALRAAADSRALVTDAYSEELLPRALTSALGPPASGRFHVVPITGGDKVILLAYLDNDDRLQPVEGLDVIELAGAHIGLMFENDLLKRRFGVSGREKREPTISSGAG